MVRHLGLIMVAGSALVAARANGAFVYASDGNSIYKVNVDAMGGPTAALLRANAGAFNLSAGGNSDQLYVHDGGSMYTYAISTDTLSGPTGVSVGGNAFGEGLDGYWYMGASNFIIRHEPENTSFTPVVTGGQPDLFAGDFATANDGTSYGAMNGGISIINKNTAAQTPFSPLAGMWGLAFTNDGRMIAGSSSGDLYNVNLVTGVPTLLGNIGFSIGDLASERGVIVPAPGAGALLGLALVGARGGRSRRRGCGLDRRLADRDRVRPERGRSLPLRPR